mmetsp:Transcript_9166/g.17220  ORF Transcript_9166/g.17220 Transcript_9166/m.17220 type:complete len:216 (-) Transcript_9166:455-1102(-)|eukprot:CAMPEP_0175042798 /NCGR_PEP_ID=MMETSP0052_2-20121109/2787_1 /TAXON_ID=51329 ORGANISM="Polytomella parva, Strain SAG 63-3" /NCGR_SAMPLE_ID=MMETSP0052_2 /ASSEMBLY_ACC=CAM_ASM_000194 /LENGTH=215 /DNA_ID=CAMNT_0016305697 /DNA_START=115 /DNA_END=762 /DNA_ORIENTATION=+
MSCTTVTLEVASTVEENSTDNLPYDDDIERIIFSADEIAVRIKELGKVIAAEYKDKAPIVVPVLKGSVLFFVDLVKAIQPCPRGLTLDFVRANSYGSRTVSSGDVKLGVDIDPETVRGRNILLIEDIIDTGRTITRVTKWLVEECGAASVACATLLDKAERRVVEYKPKYVCFQCPNDFVVGFGLDFNEEYRTLPYIGVLKSRCYEGLIGMENAV